MIRKLLTCPCVYPPTRLCIVLLAHWMIRKEVSVPSKNHSYYVEQEVHQDARQHPLPDTEQDEGEPRTKGLGSSRAQF